MTNECSFLHNYYLMYEMIKPRENVEPLSFKPDDLYLCRQLFLKHALAAFHEYHKFRKPKAKFIGDKLPAQTFYVDWLRENFKGVKFLWCVRDAKKNIESMKKGTL